MHCSYLIWVLFLYSVFDFFQLNFYFYFYFYLYFISCVLQTALCSFSHAHVFYVFFCLLWLKKKIVLLFPCLIFKILFYSLPFLYAFLLLFFIFLRLLFFCVNWNMKINLILIFLTKSNLFR